MATTFENKVTLTDCKLYKEDNHYYLSLKYEIEELDGIYELNIPKVDLCIPTNTYHLEKTYSKDVGWGVKIPCEEAFFYLNDPERIYKLPVYAVDGEFGTKTLIKKKTRKMTLAEIEKELGYKVEVVSKK